MIKIVSDIQGNAVVPFCFPLLAKSSFQHYSEQPVKLLHKVTYSRIQVRQRRAGLKQNETIGNFFFLMALGNTSMKSPQTQPMSKYTEIWLGFSQNSWRTFPSGTPFSKIIFEVPFLPPLRNNVSISIYLGMEEGEANSNYRWQFCTKHWKAQL